MQGIPRAPSRATASAVAAPKKTSALRAPKKTAAAESSTPAKKRAVARAVPTPENSRPTLASSHRKSSTTATSVKSAGAASKAKPAKAGAKSAAKATPKVAPKGAVKAKKVAEVTFEARAEDEFDEVLEDVAEVAPKKSAAKASVKGSAELPLPARVRKAKGETAVDEAAALGKVIALAALDKKAQHVEVIDVRGRLDYADVIVLASGRSDRQALAIAQAMEDDAKVKLSRRTISVEGTQVGQWILLDFGDVVAHVFTEEARHLYDLDGLFEDAEKIPV